VPTNSTDGSTSDDEPVVLSAPVSAHLFSEMRSHLVVQVKDDGTGINQLTNALVARYQAAVAELGEATAAIVKHCRKTGQTVPFDFLYPSARTVSKLPAKTKKGKPLPPWLLPSDEVFPADSEAASYHECPECKKQVQHDTSNVACPHCQEEQRKKEDPAAKPGTIFAA